jgi:ATP-binding cassette subfamily F protein 3
LRKKVKDAESLIESVQKQIRELDAKLGDTSLYDRNPTEAAFLAKERAEAVRSLAKAEEKWLTASAELEEAMAEAD